MYNDDWECIGTVGVDAGMIWIGDPCYVMGDDAGNRVRDWCGDFVSKCDFDSRSGYFKPLGDNTGIGVSSGYGDGLYEVFVKRSHGRIAEAKIVFIDENEEW